MLITSLCCIGLRGALTSNPHSGALHSSSIESSRRGTTVALPHQRFPMSMERCVGRIGGGSRSGFALPFDLNQGRATLPTDRSTGPGTLLLMRRLPGLVGQYGSPPSRSTTSSSILRCLCEHLSRTGRSAYSGGRDRSQAALGSEGARQLDRCSLPRSGAIVANGLVSKARRG